MVEVEVDMAAAERQLASAVRRHRARAAALAEAEADRDDAIRTAIAAKLPRHRVVAITELSPARVDQIRRGGRQ